MAGTLRAHQGVLCISPVRERISWPGWEGVGKWSWALWSLLVEVLDGKGELATSLCREEEVLRAWKTSLRAVCSWVGAGGMFIRLSGTA